MSAVNMKLNPRGVKRFSEYIEGGAMGAVPIGLLSDPETSDPTLGTVPEDEGGREFASRWEFGRYLSADLLQNADRRSLWLDFGLWAGLSLIWFDQICPIRQDGARRVARLERYILSASFRTHYRHAVRTPWWLVGQYGDDAKFLLVGSSNSANPLSVHGEILEQLAGRQQALASENIVAVASEMYWDEKRSRPRAGAGSKLGGSARRLGLVLRQLDLTHDLAVMNKNELRALIPPEFDRWFED